jgi:hypothetical protein
VERVEEKIGGFNRKFPRICFPSSKEMKDRMISKIMYNRLPTLETGF